MYLNERKLARRCVAVLLVALGGNNFGSGLLAAGDVDRATCGDADSYNQGLAAQAVKNSELPVFISRQDARSDIQYLKWRLEIQSSYLRLRDFDYQQALDCLEASLPDPVNTLTFARSLQKVIMQLGDAHARVRVDLDAEDDRYLPFIIADTADGVVAIKQGKQGFLAGDYPFLAAIDGQPLSQLMGIAGRFVPQASPQLIRRGALRELRSIDRLRVEQGMARSSSVRVTLQAADGSKSTELSLETRSKRLPGGKLSFDESRVLEGNIGYLRIDSMDDSKIDRVLSSMASFSDTAGLIIDVRGNRGGKYGILRALYGYFVPDESPPYVTNIAAYRLSPKFDRDYLHYRHTYRMDHPGWTPAQRRAIIRAMAEFSPEWRFPEGQFSEWHFMVLGKSGDPGQYYYRQPVAVLSDAASFSATDGFLSAFADIPGVVLIGEPSSGGSGATRYFTLPNSEVRILLSTMVSFRPNGKLLDGNGIEVDIEVLPAPADFVGPSDAALQRARDWIAHALEQVGSSSVAN